MKNVNENDIAQALSYDFSDATSTFADELLNQALEQLGDNDGCEIPAEALEQLAAAGDFDAALRRPEPPGPMR